MNYKNIRFKISNISTERKTNGDTNLEAWCFEGNKIEAIIEIKIPNSKINDKKLIRERLEEKFLSKFNKEPENGIKIGDVL